MNQHIVKEELTKADVQRMIDNSIESKDTEKYIKKVCDDVLENMFKTLWQRKGFWKK
jgi:diphthamide synthase (EF-2-diphthine--ammonia ligase)